jgi:hypothetical protein
MDRDVLVPGIFGELKIDRRVARRHSQFGVLGYILDTFPAIVDFPRVAQTLQELLWCS